MTKVLFVCTMNTARSVMAEMILKKYGGDKFIPSSAGIFTTGFTPMEPFAYQTLLKEGVGANILNDFYSRKVKREYIEENDIIVGITPEHMQALKAKYPEYADKITTFDSPVENPWNDEDSYEKCFESIKENVMKMFSLSDKDITVRTMDASGASQSAALEAECFSNPWTLEEYEKARQSDDHICLCGYVNAEYAGFVMAYRVLDEGHLLDIAVRPKFRRCGVAKALIEELSSRLEKAGVTSVMLEVREHNIPARALYSKLGFKDVGKRKYYYKDPTDDAILCTLVLKEKENNEDIGN